MKKTFLSGLSALLVGSALFTGGGFATKVNAQSSESYDEYFTNSIEDDETIVSVYRNTANGLKKLSIEDVKALSDTTEQNDLDKKKSFESINHLNKEDEVNPLWIIIRQWHEYEYKKRGGKEVTYEKERKRASSVWYNTKSTPVERSFKVSGSTQLTKNVTLNSDAFKILKASISSSAVESASFEDSIKETVSPGYSAWIEFVPIKYNTWGTMYDWVYKITDISNGTPDKSLDTVDEIDYYFPLETRYGEADGIFVLKEKKGEYTP
ncbi:hypothetical protein EEL30_22280 [Brevibacillus laterosporus]|uniref:Toxin n=1 Tax=Brevibacillus laterosporus TaxID=1465 RepID=A0A518VCP2_BRELA|nr:hypothetical protein EEL30_22280 [Brevibacillus laterosporus]